jgi:3-oxoacyl-[acyl-carrier-protein] synthase-3
MNIGITGLGTYLPARVLTNDDVQVLTGYDPAAKRGQSLDAWVTRYHGGRERRRAAADEATSDLATHAARAALSAAGRPAADIDLLVLATVTSDYRLPPSAAVVQANLGLQGKFLQLDSACTGFIDCVLTASALLRAGAYRRALVVCADSCQSYLDPGDWLTQTVFGDGAAAAVLDRVPDGYGFTDICSGSEGDIGHYVRILAGGSRCATSDPGGRDPRYFAAEFGDISRWGVPRMVEAAQTVLKQAGLDLSDVAWLVPHQASARMIRAAAAELGFPDERVIMTYPELGNTVGSSVALAMHAGAQQGLFRDGDLLLLTAVGAGMAWGSALYRWQDRAAQLPGTA